MIENIIEFILRFVFWKLKVSDYKTLVITRGASKKPLELKNGDKYDSRACLYDEYGKCIYTTELVNTDPTVKHKGGVLAEGTYWGLVSDRGKTKAFVNNCIRLFRRDTDLKRIKNKNSLTLNDITLPSKIANPTHKGKKIMTAIQIHAGSGKTWDISEGCLTLPNNYSYKEFDRLYSKFNKNEIIKIVLK